MKKLIIGLVIGLMLGMSTNAFAAIGDTVQATFAQFNYVVNGVSKTIDAPVLVYEGTSYVRTTQISNMLGFDVTYKSDSRTIAFSGGQTPSPTTSPSIAPTSTPTSVTGDTYGATPTPSVTSIPSGTLDPNATPAPSITPTTSPDPNVTPVPTVEPTPTVAPSPTIAPTPTPAPSNTAQCQSIRDSYASQIVMVQYEGGSQGQHLQKVLVLQYQRDQALSAAGCN